MEESKESRIPGWLQYLLILVLIVVVVIAALILLGPQIANPGGAVQNNL